MGSQRRGDPQGYYRTLGLEPGASASQIKAAYRLLAMELHPDRNPGRDTTAQFQALRQAYSVLSAAKKREQYDADSVVQETRTPEPEPESGAAPHYAPIYCSRCRAVSAQPRYTVFYTVTGWIWGAARKATQGVFCGSCEFQVGWRATAMTLVAGWWSLTGPWWTCQTVMANFRGGRFDHQNAQLMGYQAMYLANAGRIELALAVAAQAMALIQKAERRKGDITRLKGSSGSGHAPSELAGLAGSLRDLMDAYAGKAGRQLLKAHHTWGYRRALAQGFVTVTFAALLVAALSQTMVWPDAADPALDSGQTPGSLKGVRPQASSFANPARLFKPSTNPGGELVQEVGALQQQALNAPAYALPPSGIFRSLDPILVPPGGLSDKQPGTSFLPDLNNHSGTTHQKNPPFRIVNPVGSHKWLKLIRVSDEAEVLSVFIRSGDTVVVMVPVGTYRAKVASGQIWYGESTRFGPQTHYFRVSAALDFNVEGGQLFGQELTLMSPKYANRTAADLDAGDF